MNPPDPFLAALLSTEDRPALVDDWLARDDELHWIARALRRDLPLIVARPELALPCLHRRCAWLGHPNEHTFYADRVEPSPTAQLAAARVRAWEAAIEQPWARSLRPSPLPLDAAVLEEYRTDRAGVLRWSPDGCTLGVADAIAWDRATGAPSATALPPRHAPRWRLEGGWGRLVLIGDAGSVALPWHADHNPTTIVELSPGYVLVRAIDIDGGVFCALVTLGATPAIAWRQEHDAIDAELASDGRVYVAVHGYIAVYDLATGRALGGWSVPHGHALAISPDATLAAVRDGPVIRVWDIAAALARPQPRLLHQVGYVEAQLSPDEAYLVTGSLLCDARRGWPIATLGVDRGNYLEGGPPPFARRLCDGIFVEINPFGLTAWSTRDGTMLLFDRERRATTRDLVRFDPTGRFHVLVNESRLAVYRIEGSLLFERAILLPTITLPNRLGFSSDGETVWWRDHTDAIWAVATAATDHTPHRVLEPPIDPEPRRIAIRDGMLIDDDLAIPCDDLYVIESLDRAVLAGRTSHYARITPGTSRSPHP